MFRRRRFLACLIMGMMIALLLSACGKAGRDEIRANMEESQTGGTSSSGTDASSIGGGDVSVPAIAEDVQEHISYSYQSENTDSHIDVDADVVATGYGNVAVYEQSVKELDDEVIREIADNLFDNGEYELIKPYEISTIDELNQEKEYLEALVHEYQITDISSERGFDKPYILELIDSVDFYIDNYDESKVADVPEGQLIMYVSGGHYEDIGTEGDKIIEEESGNECSLRGTVNGEVWMLYYSETDDYYSHGLKIFALTQDTVEYVNANLTGYDDINVIKYGENRCDYNQAELDAGNLLERIGFEDMEVAHSCQVIVSSEAESDYMDGYGMMFARNVDGIRSGYSQLMVALSDTGIAQQSYIYVHVNSSGVQYIGISILYDLGERLSDSTTLLEFDKIDLIAQEYIPEMIESHDNEDPDTPINMVIDRVELNYVIVTYDGAMYSLVPVWLYYQLNEPAYQPEKFAVFGINAIDGSIVSIGASNITGNVLLRY